MNTAHASPTNLFGGIFLRRDVIDHLFITQTSGRISLVEYDLGSHPPTCLDLGCGEFYVCLSRVCESLIHHASIGTGGQHPLDEECASSLNCNTVWILAAAKEWPGCRFTGLDLCQVQPETTSLPNRLPPALASRISWVRGNFLASPLPFPDSAFHHAHIQFIANGVPEDKWDVLIAEVVRVLRPGGVLEIMEEDIIFPTLPKRYTALSNEKWQDQPAAVTRESCSSSSDSSSVERPAHPSPHDHAFLEELYYAVFDRRFINTEPTTLLPLLV